MSSFFKTTIARVFLVMLSCGGVVSIPSVAHAVQCDSSATVQAPSSSQPVSLSITGTHIKRESMDALWEITTSENQDKFVLLGRAIGAAHDWFGTCTYPGLGIGNGSGFDYLSKNVTVWLWHSEVNLDLAREAIYNLIGETDGAARLVGPAHALINQPVDFDAADSMPAFIDLSYSWDIDNDGDYEVSTGTSSVLKTSFITAGVHSVGVKVVRPSGATREARTTIRVMLAPTSPTPGISILNGQGRVNQRDVVVNMVWPAYATHAFASNDGAFHPMRTTLIDLADTFAWTLDDGGSGVYSSAVFVRFVGPGVDDTRSYWDTIVLESNPATTTSTTAPETTTSTTAPPSDIVVQSMVRSKGVASMSIRSLTSRMARSSQRVVAQVTKSSSRICRLSGDRVVALRSGECAVRITVHTANGTKVSRVLSFSARR